MINVTEEYKKIEDKLNAIISSSRGRGDKILFNNLSRALNKVAELRPRTKMFKIYLSFIRAINPVATSNLRTNNDDNTHYPSSGWVCLTRTSRDDEVEDYEYPEFGRLLKEVSVFLKKGTTSNARKFIKLDTNSIGKQASMTRKVLGATIKLQEAEYTKQEAKYEKYYRASNEDRKDDYEYNDQGQVVSYEWGFRRKAEDGARASSALSNMSQINEQIIRTRYLVDYVIVIESFIEAIADSVI